MNSRPLSNEYEVLEGDVLTPSHLIYGRAIKFIPQNEETREVSCGNRFRYVTVRLQHFWNRWQIEYLTGLREFHKCKSAGKGVKLQVGDVVPVYGEGEKRGNWKLAIVEELISGKDKEVRGARVRLVQPIYLKRPVQKLYLLEIQPGPGGNREEQSTPLLKSNGCRGEQKNKLNVRDELLQRFQNRRRRRC